MYSVPRIVAVAGECRGHSRQEIRGIVRQYEHAKVQAAQRMGTLRL